MRSTAVGEGATAGGLGALSFGNLASAAQDNSAAIGNGATSTRANQFVLGNAANTYTLTGIDSAASRAAQTGDTRFVTSDANGNLATASGPSVGALTSAIGSNTAGVAANSRAITRNEEGIAMAMALKAPYVPADRSYAMSAGVGAFGGSQALAVSMGARLNANTQIDAGVTYGFNQRQVGGRVGVTWAW